MAKPNILIRSKKAKATELLNHNQLSEAAALLAGICLSAPTDVESWVMRGLVHRKLRLFNEAEEFCRRALRLQPAYAWGHHVLGSVLQCQGHMEEALASYRTSISLQPGYAEAHYFLANALRETWAIDEAIKSYRRAIQLQPDFVEALSNLGAALTSRGESQEAAHFLNKANALRPNSSEIIFNMGRALQLDGRIEEAIEKYQRALILAPNSMHIIGKLADTLEMANRLEEAQALIDQELPRARDNPALLIPAAKLARRAKKIDVAIALFEHAMAQKLEREIAGDVHLQLGQLYDKKNDADHAYAHIAEGNRLIAQSIEGTYSEHNDFVAAVERRHRYLSTDLANVTPLDPVEGDAEDPVFLFGFARSGTTLLGQILDSHPALQTLDEKSMGTVMVKAFEGMTQGRINALETLTDMEIARLRKVYFDEAARHIKRQPGSLLVDKMPLNTINVALIWRVFPRAKIIFVARHPCDVCLSCFMQNFGTNGALTSFFTLESGVSVYAKVMQIWLDAVRMLPLNYHQIRYEDLVTDFEQESHALVDFLGVGWNESVREHDKHAMSHSKINTPSYHQVTQPIYQHAKYRWKRYSKQFELVMPTLQPYIEYFNY